MKGGTWESGTWKSGTWYDGTWLKGYCTHGVSQINNPNNFNCTTDHPNG